AFRLLHHSIVNRGCRRGPEGVWVKANEIEVALGSFESLPCGSQDPRRVAFELFDHDVSSKCEIAGVPKMPGLDVFLSELRVRLLDKTVDGESIRVIDRLAQPDVAETSGWRGRHNTKRHDVAFASDGGGSLDAIPKSGLVADDMVCRKRQN